ncbi:3-isopropylmalate dehydratase small subunit [Steroidobacter sp. S1-65]|uniref:3-isopropylmalate dehydratase n=1 Tax=Steroidobacter gossypii TaxID=2805490 RepID=A0ABS1X057_9GAMM|nr:3-isopropylmalate dehydratase small subunit [Steroidobacter gossypii]MBM0106597.1 3-isopropylmalate dehydratase small subunit [Steroidobacter gossypii]
MSGKHTIAGVAAALPIANLDTDQIMPKQFLRGIDKAGLDRGVLYDLRFDGEGRPRYDFILNRAEYADCRILVAGENFGCGSSREHAVWGLLQFGIRAVIAPSFGEIFHSNAMNNALLLVAVSQADVDRFTRDVEQPASNRIEIDVDHLQVRSRTHDVKFTMSARHRAMFLEGQDLIGASLVHAAAIAEFERKHWDRQPWLQSIGAVVRARKS